MKSHSLFSLFSLSFPLVFSIPGEKSSCFFKIFVIF